MEVLPGILWYFISCQLYQLSNAYPGTRLPTNTIKRVKGTEQSVPMDAFSLDCLESHNKYRAKHGVAPLSWSAELAESAAMYAKQIAADENFEHDQLITEQNLGENLARFYPPVPKCEGPKIGDCVMCREMVKAWYDEIKNYDFDEGAANNPSFPFNKATQVVWAGTTELGVGTATSPKLGFITVARYRPRGNVGQPAMYKQNVPPYGGPLPTLKHRKFNKKPQAKVNQNGRPLPPKRTSPSLASQNASLGGEGNTDQDDNMLASSIVGPYPTAGPPPVSGPAPQQLNVTLTMAEPWEVTGVGPGLAGNDQDMPKEEEEGENLATTPPPATGKKPTKAANGTKQPGQVVTNKVTPAGTRPPPPTPPKPSPTPQPKPSPTKPKGTPSSPKASLPPPTTQIKPEADTLGNGSPTPPPEATAGTQAQPTEGGYYPGPSPSASPAQQGVPQDEGAVSEDYAYPTEAMTARRSGPTSLSSLYKRPGPVKALTQKEQDEQKNAALSDSAHPELLSQTVVAGDGTVARVYTTKTGKYAGIVFRHEINRNNTAEENVPGSTRGTIFTL